jgi:hypothetical protein
MQRKDLAVDRARGTGGVLLHTDDGPAKITSPSTIATRGSLWQADNGAQPGCVVLQRYLSALGADELSNDSQAKPGASGVAAAGVVETSEALEYVLALFGWDAGAVVGHADDGATPGTVTDVDGDGGRGVPDGVVDEVCHDPLHGVDVRVHDDLVVSLPA